MQELILNSYLAYKAGRSFVFANYTWTDDSSLYSDVDGKKVTSQIPYSVMIRGPSIGDPFPEGAHAPSAVSREYFEQICPRKMSISREAVQGSLSEPLNAEAITNAWLARLANVQEPCVQAERDSGQLYDFLDRKAMLDIWSSLSRSPILTHFGWSSLVELAFDTNRDFFSSPTVLEPYLSGRPYTTNADRYSMIPGLMVVHVRRGDYEQRCTDLADWGSTYLAMNSFPDLPDQYSPPLHGEGLAEVTRVRELVRSHCYPNVQEIVDRVKLVRESPAAQGINRIYVMSDGDPTFLHELALALHHDAPWDSIATSRDVILNVEQRFISQAVDMLVGQRAQVFIGNGFSSVTSNVVTMRLANRFRHDSTRFW
ncbi:uncharacterized protein TRAVEDRAFT_156917 [Trametes versicolor FP-101664 SS1]|uniref:Uncharacterized protein n=1 Tax=Trametes versicolor (strain FP-101664) TaxID=717944 RepID=R7S746_TRAVS|nr:uncharacterized protein TRAVEDRAFT_156917 [Trametes versicolor FP-101664 SS1]EIW51761.1 hypothetical protein TRAVEDRAFT_156917 [Trametes versicolor FP-101664 SS1]